MIFLSRKKLKKIEGLFFSESNFEKFENPKHPQYDDYKDRDFEKGHDRGYNNAIEDILRIIDD